MVYVVKDDGSKNLVPASAFGDISVLSIRELPMYGDPGPMIASIRTALAKFNSDDFILLIGDPVLIGIAFYYAARANNGAVTCLKWDKQQKQYFPIKLNL